MSEISFKAVMISTAAYVLFYFLFYKRIAGDNEENSSPAFTPENMITVPVSGLIFSFFLAMFMLMAERTGMADGIKSGFMLTFAVLCPSLLVSYRSSGKNWMQALRTCAFFLICHTLCGAMIGLWSA